MSNQTVQKVKITTACPKCKWDGVSGTDSYCSMCKAPLDDLKYICEGCGIKVLIRDNEYRYCNFCGHPTNMEIIR